MAHRKDFSLILKGSQHDLVLNSNVLELEHVHVWREQGYVGVRVGRIRLAAHEPLQVGECLLQWISMVLPDLVLFYITQPLP